SAGDPADQKGMPRGGGDEPAFSTIEGDFDMLGVQLETPAPKPTSYLLLPNKPIADTVEVKVNGVLLAPERFQVTGNTLTFLDAGGVAESISGFVEAKYDYKEAIYNASFVKHTVVDIYDEDTQTVIIQMPDDGSIDVIEGSAASDQYSVRLSQAPTSDVTIKVDAVSTRSTYGRTALFQEQVTVNGGSETFLTFTSSNWFTPQNVI